MDSCVQIFTNSNKEEQLSLMRLNELKMVRLLLLAPTLVTIYITYYDTVNDSTLTLMLTLFTIYITNNF